MTRAWPGRWRQRRHELAEESAFAAIVRSSQDAVIAKTVDGTVTAWNDGAFSVYGFTAEQMIGQSIELTIPREALEEERARHARVARGAPESGYRCMRLRTDGRPIEVVMSMSPVRDQLGRVIGVASISRAVSAAERADERFASLLEAAPDAIICVGRDGRIVTANVQAGKLFGYDRDDLLGTEMEILLPESMRESHVAHRAAFARHPQVRTMGSGLSLLARRRDGSTFPVEVSLAPDQVGAEEFVIAAVRDVSEQRALETESRENEARLRQLAESGGVLYVLLQLDPPQYLYVSPGAQRLIGVDPGEGLKAGQVVEALHPDDRQAFEHGYYAASRAGLAASTEVRMVGPDGDIKWVRAVATPVPNPLGPPERTVIALEDVTERVLAAKALRDAEAEARAANEAKNHFLSRMSHELRTPLNAVIGFGQILEVDELNDDQREAVGYILGGGRHLLNLINDVLDISRVESGDISISLESVAVLAIIDETIQLMGPEAADAGVTLTATAGPREDNVLADRQRLRQILLNLVSNAIKYNRPGGNTWIGWNVRDGRASLTVQDDGPGIAQELQSRLFTPFDRLGAESSGVDGTGIGLALTRCLAELMGGSVSVVSAPGEGSCFTVWLPAASAVADGGYVDSPLQSLHGAAKSPLNAPATVLYIEDNGPNVRLVEHVLQLRPGWRLVHAALGSLGVELAQSHRPDLVLLDLHLPDLSGQDVLVALKHDPRTCAIPVAILTADASASQPGQLFDAGADSFLTKPLDLDKMLALLDDVVLSRDSRQGIGA